VAVSGGSNSMAMLHMLWNCLNANKSQKKMFFSIHVLYIQESCAVFGTEQSLEDERRDIIISLCNKYGFTYTVISIESVYTLMSHQTIAKFYVEEAERPKY
jgi:tRNA(Ile)-lysidine synthase TilS/MesJ